MSSDVTIIIEDGGVLMGGVVPPPFPPADLSVYSDVPSSITSSGGLVSAWGGFVQASGGSQPELITDSVTGLAAIRFDSGKTLAINTGVVNSLSQEETTVYLVARVRNYAPNAQMVILDSSSDGATRGYQIRAYDTSFGARTRELSARVSNGSGWTIDKLPDGTIYNAYAALKTCVVAITLGPTRQAIIVDNATSYDDVISVTMPVGAAGPLVMGGFQGDVFALEVWVGGRTALQQAADVARLTARFDIDPMHTLRAGGTRYIGFPSVCICGNGDLLAVYRNGLGHAGDLGWIEAQRSSDGGATWSDPVTIQIDGTNDSRDPCLTAAPLANGDLILTWFEPTGGGNIRLRMKRSTDDGHTWGSAATVAGGFDKVNQSSGPIIETSTNHLAWPIFGLNSADTFYSAVVLVSSDNGASWGTRHIIADGTGDSKDYTETNILKLQGGTYLATIRQETDGVMVETTSADLASWSSLVSILSNVNNSMRLLQTAAGTVCGLIRPNSYSGATTISRRVSAGTWEAPPTATGVDATQSPTDYGAMVEKVPGEIFIVYGIQYTIFGPSDVRYRSMPEWQLFGEMPATVSPATKTLDVDTDQQFVMSGAGNTTWSLSLNNSGGSIDATGLYTSGGTGGVSDHVRGTDLNNYHPTDAVVTVNAPPIEPPNVTYGAALKQWLRGDLGSVSSWTDKSGNGNHATQASAPSQPSIQTGLLNGKDVYRFPNGAFMAHSLNLTAPCMVFIVMASRESLSVGEAYTAGSGAPAIEASVDVNHHWGVYGSGAHSAGVSILNTFKICCMVFRSDTDCDVITDGNVVNVNPGTPFFAIKNNVGVDNGGLADPIAVDIAEIISVQGSVTNPQLSATLTYLLDRYGAI